MRYEGLTQDVDAIEKQVNNGRYSAVREKTKYPSLFGIKSAVETHNYKVTPPNVRYSFMIRFNRDSRNGHSTIDVKDKDVGWLWKLNPDILKSLSKLEAQQEVKICMECGSREVVWKEKYWWCNSCHLPTPGIRTRWVSLRENGSN